MKLRTVKYMIKEGISNTYKNTLMSLASLGTVVASMLIFGFFLMLAINLSSNINYIQAQPEVTVFLKPELQEFGINDVEIKIKENPMVLSYKRVSKEETFNEIKKMLNNSKLTEGLSSDFLMVSFKVRLKDPAKSQIFAQQMAKIKGVDEVSFPKQAIDVIVRIVKWIHIGSMFVLIVLLIISVSIIANTIKLTVFARRKEIGIMKYVGATDWFIRWPFIIEGMIIGFVGALIAFVLTSYGYNAIELKLNTEFTTMRLGLLRMIKLKQIGAQVLTIYVIIGVIMGSVGSLVSLRKHLKV